MQDILLLAAARGRVGDVEIKRLQSSLLQCEKRVRSIKCLCRNFVLKDCRLSALFCVENNRVISLTAKNDNGFRRI